MSAGNPLKAGRGSYYDIDFALMYLRLRGAGMFYKVLNTPARIDVIEQMGHLERADADFLRDAATFYRAVDHGIRVSTGHRRQGTCPARNPNWKCSPNWSAAGRPTTCTTSRWPSNWRKCRTARASSSTGCSGEGTGRRNRLPTRAARALLLDELDAAIL